MAWPPLPSVFCCCFSDGKALFFLSRVHNENMHAVVCWRAVTGGEVFPCIPIRRHFTILRPLLPRARRAATRRDVPAGVGCGVAGAAGIGGVRGGPRQPPPGKGRGQQPGQ